MTILSMHTEILTTKFFIAPPGPNLISRSRLVDRLNREARKKLVLLSAPAGYGKTTLLSQWISQSDASFCWLGLDSGDNDLDRFLAYVISGLHSAGLMIDREILTLRQSNPQASFETVLIPLINQIATNTERVTLVLDDYHKIQTQAIHDAVGFLLDHLPAGLKLIIATRSDPPLPTARMRARGELGEIRIDDLRFTYQETAEFLAQYARLSPQQLDALVSRTEGWIASLQLFSLSLRGRKNIAAYIQSFSGNQEYIADFLATEVLNLQKPQIREFLIQTSILERFSASLCEAVTGLKNSHDLLAGLKDDNVFLIPLDEENSWFRYHHLFADLLHRRLLKASPERIPEIYGIASRWFEDNGYISEAIDYALRGEHFEQAAGLIEEQAENFLGRSEIATFLGWVQRLPEEVVRRTGRLSLYYAWALLICRGGLELAERHINYFSPRDDADRGKRNVVKSLLSTFHRNIPESIALSRKALDELSPDDFFFRQMAVWNLSANLFLQGDYEAGSHMLEEVARVSRANNNLLVAVIAQIRLGAVQFQRGHLEQAQELFERAIETRPPGGDQPLPAACEAMLHLGKVYWERFDPEKALQYLDRGLALSAGWSVIPRIDGLCTLAHVQRSQGNTPGALESLAEAKKIAVQYTPSRMDERFVETQRALICLQEGDLVAVEKWIQARDLDARSLDLDLKLISQAGKKTILAYELIVYARYLLSNNRSETALNILEQLYPTLEGLHQRLKVFEIDVLSALGHYQLGDFERAVSIFDSVLNEAGQLGCKRVYLSERALLAGVIERWNAAGYRSRFGMELLSPKMRAFASHASPSGAADSIEPLSKRETEVLHILESDLSVPEMSDLLHIAVSTLRTHIKNIYSKLDVHSRFEAVSKAKENGLL